MKLEFKAKEIIDTITVEEAITNNSSPVKMSKWSLPLGCTSPVDVHEVQEYWLIAQGSGVLNYNNEKQISVSQGDFIYMESQKTHQLENTGDQEMIVHSLWW